MTEVPPTPNVAINRDRIGDMDMYTGPTLDAMNTLARGGSSFASRWRELSGQIKAEEEALSKGFVLGDLVSAAFRENYNLAEPALTAGADGVDPMFQETATAGRGGVADYLQVDGYEIPAALRAAQSAWSA